MSRIAVVEALSTDQYTKTEVHEQKQRYARVAKTFEKRFHAKPQKFIRAPGRVNVIGEHIDYCEFGVLPAALQQDIIVAFFTQPSPDACFHLKLANTCVKYAPLEYSFDAESPILIDHSVLEWSNYVLACFSVVRKYLEHALPEPLTISLLFDGSVPAGGGLSSSAALTCSSTIAALTALDALGTLHKEQITNLAISAEHLCSISCGGMDQAASIYGQQSGLVHVEFLPELQANPISLPSAPPVELVISNSLVVADKHLTSKFNYNLRLVEVRVAAVLLAKHLQLSLDTPTTLKRVLVEHNKKRLQNETPTEESMRQLDDLLLILQEALGQYANGMEWEEVFKQLDGMTPDDFRRTFHPNFEIEADRLQVFRRARHVLTEAKRVYQFKQLLQQNSGSEDTLNKLGKLMNESHDSCRDDLQCSCPELDQLVELGRKSFSLGSRLTGAGFGGCAVHLVLSKDVPEFIQLLREDFYSGSSVATVNSSLFSTVPSSGAFVLLCV